MWSSSHSHNVTANFLGLDVPFADISGRLEIFVKFGPIGHELVFFDRSLEAISESAIWIAVSQSKELVAFLFWIFEYVFALTVEPL